MGVFDDAARESERLDRASEEYDQRATETSAETIARLVSLSAIEYDQCREAEAERLGVRVSTLDAETKKLRANGTESNAQGTAILFSEPEPWSEPVDGDAHIARCQS